MNEILITKIKTTLAGISSIKDYFSTPKNNLTKFPSVFFKPAGMVNTFETQNENMQIYRFLMVVIVGSAGTDIETAFGIVLPKVVDDIIDEFDEKWNGGTIDGHRVSFKVESIDAWEVSSEQDGKTAYAPLNIEVRLLANN